VIATNSCETLNAVTEFCQVHGLDDKESTQLHDHVRTLLQAHRRGERVSSSPIVLKRSTSSSSNKKRLPQTNFIEGIVQSMTSPTSDTYSTSKKLWQSHELKEHHDIRPITYADLFAAKKAKRHRQRPASLQKKHNQKRKTKHQQQIQKHQSSKIFHEQLYRRGVQGRVPFRNIQNYHIR
jgi:hypothetical protein